MSTHRPKDEVEETLYVSGILECDHHAITDCQRDCIEYLGFNIQLEHDAYISQHPEIGALITSLISKMEYEQRSHEEFFKIAAEFFTQDEPTLNKQILDVPTMSRLFEDTEKHIYTKKGETKFFHKNDVLKDNLRRIISEHYPTALPSITSEDLESIPTESSTFLSYPTSDTTIVTPEPIPTPPPTFEELMYQLVSNTVDKAIYFKYTDWDILYDTAYVEVCHAVEDAMEIPVVDIREEIAAIFNDCYEAFLQNILEKERIAAEIAWNKRMRKKMKRALRRLNNFIGYEALPTPPSPTPRSDSESSDESAKKPPLRPCKCHPQWTYNRYGKIKYAIRKRMNRPE